MWGTITGSLFVATNAMNTIVQRGLEKSKNSDSNLSNNNSSDNNGSYNPSYITKYNNVLKRYMYLF